MEVSQHEISPETVQKDSQVAENIPGKVAPVASHINSPFSSVIVPVDDADLNPSLKEDITNCSTVKCPGVKTSDNSYSYPPCYSCSAKASDVSLRTQSLPEIQLTSPIPTIRDHSEQVLVSTFNNSHNFQPPFLYSFNYQVHENPSVPYLQGEEHSTPSPDPQVDKHKEMPRAAVIFCRHRLRKMFLSIPVGIMSTLGILGINASFAAILNVSVLLIILVFYPLFCVLDFGMGHLSSRFQILHKKTPRKHTTSECSEYSPHSVCEGYNIHRRPRSLSHCSRLSVISNLPSIAEEEDDDRIADGNQHVCSTISENKCSECDSLRVNECSHQATSRQTGITLSVPQVIVQ